MVKKYVKVNGKRIAYESTFDFIPRAYLQIEKDDIDLTPAIVRAVLARCRRKFRLAWVCSVNVNLVHLPKRDYYAVKIGFGITDKELLDYEREVKHGGAVVNMEDKKCNAPALKAFVEKVVARCERVKWRRYTPNYMSHNDVINGIIKFVRSLVTSC